jgi:hypothetical protein
LETNVQTERAEDISQGELQENFDVEGHIFVDGRCMPF